MRLGSLRRKREALVTTLDLKLIRTAFSRGGEILIGRWRRQALSLISSLTGEGDERPKQTTTEGEWEGQQSVSGCVLGALARAMCPSWPHKAPLSSWCSPASWGMLSSHCGPGECHLMVRARLISRSPCALPSQCPRPQISQLPGTSCKKEHEAAGEDRVPPQPGVGLVSSQRVPSANTPGPGPSRPPTGCAGRAHSIPGHFPSDPPSPSSLSPGRQQLIGKGLPFCQACPYPPTPIPERPALPTALTHSAITQLITGQPFLSHTQDWKITTTLEETAPSSSNS